MGKAVLRGVVLDAGPIISFERRRGYADEAVAGIISASAPMVVPSAVVAEVWRGGLRSASVARLLKVARIAPLDEPLARAAGELLARAGSSATIDAVVVTTASWLGLPVLTSDVSDLSPLARIAGVRLEAVG